MHILVIGKNSYIGSRIKSHLEACGHTAAEVDAISDAWKTADYAGADAVVHVAAIVHNDAKTASEELFRRVNTDLPLAVAKLAKAAGVKQFIFISTMAVFGAEKTLNEQTCTVHADSPLTPVTLYGKTKLEAEKQLAALEDENFTLSIVRPPNVYGPGCRGNYIYLLQKLSRLMALCPSCYTPVRQSMLYIDNLSELIRLIAQDRAGGVFLPQDDVAPNTVELISAIRKTAGKSTHPSKCLGLGVRLFHKLSLVNKIYGGVCYDMAASEAFDGRYRIVSFADGIQKTYCAE